MQWSDVGDLNVIIRRSSLEKLDFSNVLQWRFLVERRRLSPFRRGKGS